MLSRVSSSFAVEPHRKDEIGTDHFGRFSNGWVIFKISLFTWVILRIFPVIMIVYSYSICLKVLVAIGWLPKFGLCWCKAYSFYQNHEVPKLFLWKTYYVPIMTPHYLALMILFFKCSNATFKHPNLMILFVPKCNNFNNHRLSDLMIVCLLLLKNVVSLSIDVCVDSLFASSRRCRWFEPLQVIAHHNRTMMLSTLPGTTTIAHKFKTRHGRECIHLLNT